MELITMHLLKTFILCLALMTSQTIFANNPTEDELERWFKSDDPGPPEFKQVDVNDGILSFLLKQPLKPVHHHQNSLTLSASSLTDGWVKLVQCHYNLDRVQRVQVMFNKNKVRDIEIIKVNAIESSWVENNSVQLENVKDNAILCIQAWSKALIQSADGRYHLSNGPFMRKFLDGYYPLHVTIDINFKATNLKLVQVEPMAQDGFKVTRTAKTINMDAWFEGRLKTNLTFVN